MPARLLLLLLLLRLPLPLPLPLLQLAKEGLSRVVVDDNADEQRTFSRQAWDMRMTGAGTAGASWATNPCSAAHCLRLSWCCGARPRICCHCSIPDPACCALLCLLCTRRDELKALFKVDPSQQCDTHGAIKCRWVGGRACHGGCFVQ